MLPQRLVAPYYLIGRSGINQFHYFFVACRLFPLWGEIC